MHLIKEQINIEQVKKIAQDTFGDMVKAVVDIKKGIMVIGGELHSDEETMLLEQGSNQEDLWGINIYPDAEEDRFIEFYALINLRPSFGNRTFSVDDPEIRKKIIEIVNSLIKR